jgi:cytochrome c peroxidase
MFVFLAIAAITLVFLVTPAMAQQPTTFGSASGVACPGGNVICNGSINFLTTELFFEPETPAFSLKKASTVWNELEQLLDDPNFTYTTGAACNDAAGPVPGNEQGYPTYCTNSTFIRRPTTVDGMGRFLVSTLPPLLVHPLNYNAPNGTEMRLINPNYAGGMFVNSGVFPAGNATGVCYTLGTACTPTQNSINVTSGASRLAPGETEIDYNVAIGRKLSFCQTNPEPVPLYFGTYTPFGMSTSTAADSESLTTCGSDPGEPGAASLANKPAVGPNPAATRALQAVQCMSEVLPVSLATFFCEDNVGLPVAGAPNTTWYSTPAVPAPDSDTGARMQIPNGTHGASTTGTSIILNPTSNFLLTDPARGGVIQPLNIATGVGGLRKPTLRKAEVGGTGLNPNYLWNSLGAKTVARPDPTGADLQVSNENDFVGLFPATGLTDNASLMTRKQAARLEAMVLGKSLFWDMQVGSDAVQSCGSCHAHAGADNRTKNQLNPNGQDGIRGNPTNFPGAPDQVFAPHPVNYDLTAADFPLLKLDLTHGNDLANGFGPEVAGDPLCNPAIRGDVTGISFPDGDPPDNPLSPAVYVACNSANKVSDTEEVASSMGVHFGLFGDIPLGIGLGLANPPGATSSFGPASTGGVRALIHDQRSSVALGATAAQAAIDNIDPIPGFAGTSGNQFRRVEPRNTPTIFPEDMNFDNFWDGRARHDDNGGSVFGPADPQSHVFVDQSGTGTGTLTATRQLIRFSSVGSLAKGPALSKFEMSFLNRNWAKIGKKLLQAGVTPLANQLVDPTDSILGRYSNQNGSACLSLPTAERSPHGGPPTALGTGVPGLCISYPALIQHAFYPALHSNTTQHLNGCYTDGRADIHPNQCGATVGTKVYPAASIQVLDADGVVRAHNNDPFDVFVLNIAAGPANPTDTNQFTHMEANFSFFWGQSIHLWATILVPDDTPDDKFLDINPDVGATNGETGEPLLVLDLPNCPNPTGYSRGYHLSPSSGLLQYTGSCFTEVGNFKRDDNLTGTTIGTTLPTKDANGNYIGGACIDEVTVAGTRNCTRRIAAAGTRHHGSNEPDPLLGFDIFFGSNASLKNPQFRSARCGACHNAPLLTDNTAAFTVKAMELDGFAEFERLAPDIEPLIEPLVRERVITGFLLESEIAEPGQDAIERKAPNLSIVPAPVVANNGNCTTASCSGYVFPDAITAAVDASGAAIIHSDLGIGPIAGPGTPVPFTGFGGAFLDNGVYNIGVRPCVADQTHVTGACEDTGRGNNDPFGWPLSLAALLLKNFGGPAQQPGVPIAQFDPNNANIPAGRTDGIQCAPYCSSGGLLEMSKQDQQINPGYGDDPSNPLLPSFLAHFANKIGVGDSHPQVDEGCGPAGAGCPNTLMDVANEEGFPEFGFDPRAHESEVINNSVAPGDAAAPNLLLVTPATLHGSAQMGTWPFVNRVNRFGSFKAPQLREVELTGPYFHNGGKLTLRQVVDFYVRGGDFPVTNSMHRDFNILNLNAELQSDLSEAEKVALVDYMLEFTDDRVAFEKAPFDHPQVILPLDGTAPESDGTVNRDVMLTGCIPAPGQFGPGQQFCTGPTPAPAGATGPLFLNVPATGAAGNPGGRIPNFLGIAGAAPDAANSTGRKRLVGAAAFCATLYSQYCH